MSSDATRWTVGCETGDLSFRSIIEEMMIECCCKNNVCELTLVVMEGGFCLPAPARVVGGLRRREHGRNYNSPTSLVLETLDTAGSGNFNKCLHGKNVTTDHCALLMFIFTLISSVLTDQHLLADDENVAAELCANQNQFFRYLPPYGFYPPPANIKTKY